MSDSVLQNVANEICESKRWKLLAHVGSGTFKETFRVLDEEKHVEFALKIFRPQYKSTERESREIEAMERCSHQNLGRLYYVGTFASSIGVVLFSQEEYLSGGTLSERIGTGPIPNDLLKVLGEQLISAVAHIASQNLVHRDIKPDNIMLRNDGITPVIVDLGLVRDLGKTSLTPSFVPQGPCSPYFAAPEQLRNEKTLIDWRTDQFSLGVTLAICGTGRHPFEETGDTPTQIIDRVASHGAPSEAFVAWTNANGFQVLTKMLRPWPIQRVRTSGGLLDSWRKGTI